MNSLRQRMFEAQVASCTCVTKTPEVSYHREDCTYRILNEACRRMDLLESALRFYAHGHHFIQGSTVEDGSIAKKFLLGEWQDWRGTEAPDLLPEERDAMGKNAVHSEEAK